MAAIVLELGIGDETVVTVREAQLSKAWHFHPRRAFRQLCWIRNVIASRKRHLSRYASARLGLKNLLFSAAMCSQ
jgi:hypothetical protein